VSGSQCLPDEVFTLVGATTLSLSDDPNFSGSLSGRFGHLKSDECPMACPATPPKTWIRPKTRPARVPADEQTGEEVYRDNSLDRGHLVRRLDPAWRISPTVASCANDDTFHFTWSPPRRRYAHRSAGS
jgi:hypothetical protein